MDFGSPLECELVLLRSFLWSSISNQPSPAYLEGEGGKDSQGFVFRGLDRQMGLEQ